MYSAAYIKQRWSQSMRWYLTDPPVEVVIELKSYTAWLIWKQLCSLSMRWHTIAKPPAGLIIVLKSYTAQLIWKQWCSLMTRWHDIIKSPPELVLASKPYTAQLIRINGGREAYMGTDHSTTSRTSSNRISIMYSAADIKQWRWQSMRWYHITDPPVEVVLELKSYTAQLTYKQRSLRRSSGRHITTPPAEPVIVFNSYIAQLIKKQWWSQSMHRTISLQLQENP